MKGIRRVQLEVIKARRHVRWFSWVALITSWSVSGCGPTIDPSFDSPEPAARNAAIVRAAGQEDQKAVGDLVRMLESDDPATRLLAIVTLERLTGERFGYEHGASEVEREKSIDLWEAYLQKSKELVGTNEP